MADQIVDPVIYGAKELDARPEFSAGGATGSGYVPPTAVPAVQAVQGSQLIAQGAASITANNEPKASALASVGAAMTQWTPVHLVEFMRQPKFDWEDGHNAVSSMKQVDFPLDKTQEQFLLETRSAAEFHYRLEQMREQNMAYKAMADNGLTSFAVGALDPGYLAIDAASLGVGRVARLLGASAGGARVAVGATAALGAYGIGKAEQQVQPLSDAMVYTNAMLNGAASAAFFRDGRLHTADPEFPSADLHRIAESTGPTPHTAGHPDFVGPVDVVPTVNAAEAAAADNLSRSRVPATGEGNTAVRYGDGSTSGEYNPAYNLSRAEQAAMHQEGRVTHVESVADIAQHAESVRMGRTVIDTDAKAVYLPAEDRVFLVKGNIKPGDDVKGILLHEVGVHMNAERVLGTERLGRMLSTLEDMALSGNSRAKQAFADVPANTPHHLVREEALGYYIERNHGHLGDGIVAKFVHGVKEVLRKAGLKGLKLSENDLSQLIRKSAKGKAGASFDSAFPYVWHGSPVKGIEALDTAFIGTGEGNKAFGFGHYLTSEKGTALDYRNKESVRRGLNPEQGGLYRMKINAGEHQFLDLDVRAQSATVQAALDKFGVRHGVTGKTAYDYLAKKFGSDKLASEALHAEGVAGNKYATGRTRNSGVKSSNYVVFHNDALDMVARYSKDNPFIQRATDAKLQDLFMDASARWHAGDASARELMDSIAREQVQRRNTHMRAEAGVREIHPGYESIPEGTMVAFKHDGETLRAPVVRNRTLELKSGKITMPRVELPSGKSVWLEPEQIEQVFGGPKLFSPEARYSKPLGPTSQAQAQKTVAQRIGKSIEWSLHKTMAKYSDTAKKVADLLVDDPLEMAGNSVVSQHRAIRADLQRTQAVFENLLADHMASQGAGLLKRIISPRESLATQRAVERDVYMEMMRRNRLSIDGMPISHTGIPAHVKGMADALEAVARESRAELKRSGVFGADTLKDVEGYVNRRWDISKIEAIEAKLVAGGSTLAAARLSIQDSMSVAIQRVNGWDAQLASDVAKSILDRTRSKGYFEDSAFRRAAGDDGLAEVRNILTGSGITGARMQRVLDVLAAKTDEAGKASMLKHRVDMALDETLTMPDGSTHTLADMLDTNVTGITERYLDSVASQAAFARKGLTKSSDVTDLRTAMLESVGNKAEREQAAKLFDNTVASLRGEPVGEELPNFMRKAQAVTQMVGLARAGVFQFTEYSTAMAHYGAARTIASALAELPVLRTILGNAKDSQHLASILAGNASADMRLRPFVNRMEDNFEIPISDTVHMGLMQAKQLVPYFNALKFVQGHQSRTVANLIVDTFHRGAQGETKALAALEKYGLESHIMGQVRNDINAHGMDTAKWSDATWDAVRGPLNKMMDDAVLRNRTGEIPAFAQFTSTGKFIFTFRSFVLGAHNKVLAGGLNRSGFMGLGLMMLYQFPLTYAATQAANTVAGKPAKTDKQALGEAFSQMGSLGLLSEIAGVAFQNKQQFGSPGTIGIDHVYKLGAAAASGSGNATAAAASSMVPLLSVILPLKAIGENLKGK